MALTITMQRYDAYFTSANHRSWNVWTEHENWIWRAIISFFFLFFQFCYNCVYSIVCHFIHWLIDIRMQSTLHAGFNCYNVEHLDFSQIFHATILHLVDSSMRWHITQIEQNRTVQNLVDIMMRNTIKQKYEKQYNASENSAITLFTVAF